MPLERLHRRAAADGRAALPHPARPHRREPPLPHGRRDDQRRRLRGGLVRPRPQLAGALSQRQPGLERPEHARAGRPHRDPAVPRAHQGGDRQPGPADQLPSLPPQALAVRAQRLPGRHRGRAARPAAGGGSLALQRHRGIHRLRAALPPGAHVRARARPARGDGAGGRARGIDRPASAASPTRFRAPSASATASASGRSATPRRMLRARSSSPPTWKRCGGCTPRTSGCRC